MKKQTKQDIRLDFKREVITPYTEKFENTLNNLFAMALLQHQIFGRLGYQIKLQEQILEELKKINKGDK